MAEDYVGLRKLYQGKLTSPMPASTYKVDARPRPKPQQKKPAPKKTSTLQTIGNVLSAAPSGFKTLATMLPQMAVEYAQTHTPREVLSDVKSGLGSYADYWRRDPASAAVDLVPFIGDAKAVGEMTREADAARAAGNEELARQIESFVLPVAALGVVPEVGGLATKALRGAARGVKALPEPNIAKATMWPDEGQWSLPADFGTEVPITTTGPAIIHRQKPVETWHGTPHVFAAERKVKAPSGEESFISGAPDVLPDVPSNFSVLKDYPLGRFRSERLGSGEGAQQYGIGTYLAESPDVARNYRSELTQDADPAAIAGVPLEAFYSQLQRRADMAAPDRAEAMYDRLSALEDLGLHGDIRGVLERAQEGAYLPGTTEWFQKEIAPKYSAPGALYQVDLGVDPREFLDYDAPLANQSAAIREAAANLDLSHLKEGNRSRVMVERFLANNEQDSYPLTGNIFMAALPHTMKTTYAPEASQYLLKHGIPGIRYWDEGSREARRGTRNFVVFNPERDLTIKERFAHGGLAVKRKKK